MLCNVMHSLSTAGVDMMRIIEMKMWRKQSRKSPTFAFQDSRSSLG